MTVAKDAELALEKINQDGNMSINTNTNTNTNTNENNIEVSVDDDVDASVTTAATNLGKDRHSEDDDDDGINSTADGSTKPVPSQPPSLSKIFGMARPEIKMLFFALLLMVAAESTGLILPLIIANAYDVLVENDNENGNGDDNDDTMSDINYYMAIALIIYAAGLVAGFFRSAILGVIGERMVARLRCQLYASILYQEIGFFDEHKSGELVSRLGSDTALLQQVISQSIPEAIMGVIKTVVAIGLMFYLSPTLAGVSIASVVIILCVALPLGKLLGRLSKSYQDVLGEAQNCSTEAFGSMRTVQSFAAEEKERKRYTDKIGNPDDYPRWYPSKPDPSTYRIGFFKSLTTASFYVFIFGTGFGCMYVALWYGFYLVEQGEMSLGDLTAFQSYIFTIGFGLGGSATHFAKVFEGLGASGRIFFLLERVPAIPKPAIVQEKTVTNKKDNISENIATTLDPIKEQIAKPLSLTPTNMIGDIDFQHVNFSYPSRPDIQVLKDFTLRIAANTTTALVGSSGAGKSTVVSLIQRFYDIDSGKITIDGNDLEELSLRWVRQHIGYVQQEPQLFGLSVRENLLYGVENQDKITDEEIEQACRDANAYDFIMKWPKGFDTLVGERGVKMSGGQKQRVAIARALLTKCRILLLDEATSALDAESEYLVQEAIDKAVKGRTVIVVAHRLSTIQRADQIVVMADHQIVDYGPHGQLMERCQKYQDLIKRQSMITQATTTAI